MMNFISRFADNIFSLFILNLFKKSLLSIFSVKLTWNSTYNTNIKYKKIKKKCLGSDSNTGGIWVIFKKKNQLNDFLKRPFIFTYQCINKM